MVSQYDVFLAGLLRCLFQMKPEVLNASDRKISYSEIIAFTSIQQATETIVDAEIDAVLRKSLIEQFTWLENKFSVSLRTDLTVWPELVELVQRRNLFVHADGIVSKQYLEVCESQGCDIKDVAISLPLSVGVDYLNRARDILFEVSVKLSQVLWRKLDPNSLESADSYMNSLGFDLLQTNRLSLAKNLLDFAFMKPMRRWNKETELMLTVNRANAHLLGGDEKKALELLGNDDWSAYDLKFRLARAVIIKDQTLFVKYMKEIGDCGTPSKHDYRDWPLFSSVKEMAAFREAFKEIFGEDFNLPPKMELTASIDANSSAEIATENDETATEKIDLASTIQSIFSNGELRGWVAEFLATVKEV